MTAKVKRLLATILFIHMTLPFASTPSKGKSHFLVGGAHVSQGTSQFIGVSNSFGNIHRLNKDSDTVFVGGVGYLINAYKQKAMDVSLGISAYYINNAKTNGLIVIEQTCPDLSYQYDTVNIPFYGQAKALWTSERLPFLVVTDVGAGINLLTTKNYHESSIDNGVTIPNQAFTGHTSVKFSAMGGVGLRFNQAIKNSDIEIGYKYFYLNKGKLKPRALFLNELTSGTIDAHAITLTLIAD